MASLLEGLHLADVAPSSITADAQVRAIFDAASPELGEVTSAAREALILSRLDELPAPVVDLLAWAFHVDFYDAALPLGVRRRLVRASIPWHRKKGTKWAVEKALRDLGFLPTIKEWFEPDMLTEAHTFSVTGYFEEDPYVVEQLGPDTEGILLRAVMEAKPARSWLLHLTIVPPEIDWGDHLCLWDVCTWEHGEPRSYEWGGLGEDGSYAFEVGAELASELSRVVWRDGAMETLREDRWDIVAWGVPIRRGEREGADRTLHIASSVTSEMEGLDAPPLTWRGRRTWRGERTWRSRHEHVGGGWAVWYTEEILKLKAADEFVSILRGHVSTLEAGEAAPRRTWRRKRRWEPTPWTEREPGIGGAWSVGWTEFSSMALKGVAGPERTAVRASRAAMEGTAPALTWRGKRTWGDRTWRAAHEGIGGSWGVTWREFLRESLKGADEAWSVWRGGLVESETAGAPGLSWRGRRRWTGGRKWTDAHEGVGGGWSVAWTEFTALPLKAVDGAESVRRDGAATLEAVEMPPLTWRALAAWSGQRHWRSRHEGLGGDWEIGWTER
ncbi:MAG: phage tail protein I [Synergistaceae bacterium]|nr:phage tail protein I [Synergistaceae bacterium]